MRKCIFVTLGFILSLCLGGCNPTAQETKNSKTNPNVTEKAKLAVSVEKPLKKEKLQIVFCFGQSNMVGLASAETAWYLTQPQYIPPKEIAVKKTRYFDWNFYWSGATYYEGPQKEEVLALVEERRLSRSKWRQRCNGAHGPWKTEEWGPKPGKGRGNMYPFLDKKAEEEGIYKRIAKILDSKENQFNVNDAYGEMIIRDQTIAEELKRVREIYLNGTESKDFDEFDAIVDAAIKSKKLITKVGKGVDFLDAAKHRAFYAQLAKKHLNLPIAKRTYIKAHGHVSGPQSKTKNAGNQKNASGRLTIGYGGGITTMGPEYGVGITLERLVDGPILIVKCSWGNTSIADAWRPSSLDGVETATEKLKREASNKKNAEDAKKAGREFTPRPAPIPTGKPSYSWGMTMPEVEKVLANPGEYHPDYDPKVGYDIAGLVWFQGYSDKDNPAYGELLAEMVKDFRKKVKTPDMPVVVGTLGMASFKQSAFSEGANAGMLQASQMPDLAGTIDVVNTAPFYPLEFNLLKQVRENVEKDSPEYMKVMTMTKRATSNKGFHYHGSAKCFLLMGDAMGRSLANLMAGGEPLINNSVK